MSPEAATCMMEGCQYPDGSATCKCCGKVNRQLLGYLGAEAKRKKERAELKRLRKANAALVEAMERSLSWLTSYPGHGADTVYDQCRAALDLAKEPPC